MAIHISDLISAFESLPPLYQAAVIVALVALVALLSLLIDVGGSATRLRLASRAGRRASAAEAIPATNFARDGSPSDPLNVRIIGDADQLAAAFVYAGWYRADEITFITALRITLDAIFGRKYSSAPVSDLYLFGRRQDFAFEKPGRSVRERDHVRFWRSARPGADGRPLWIGGATRDSKVELSKSNLLPTHGISPDVDKERNLIADDLIGAGWVIAERSVPDFPGPTSTTNATGDEYHTDGLAIELTLANVQTLPLLPQLIRQPAIGLAQSVAHAVRRNLPQQGRDLRQRWQQRKQPS